MDTVTVYFTPIWTMGGMVCAALVATWPIKKMIRYANRS